jgi:hypothetical protein
MKLYKVKASYITYLSVDIEAETEEEAWDIAKRLDGSDFESYNSEDWNIDDVIFQCEAKYSSEEA